jgi:hypothetical protein
MMGLLIIACAGPSHTPVVEPSPQANPALATAASIALNTSIPAPTNTQSPATPVPIAISTDTPAPALVATSEPAVPQLTYVTSHPLPQGTHRPEILTTETGDIFVVVVQPAGQAGVGQVVHQAYHYDSAWNQIGQPFVISRYSEEYGRPADHRATIVNNQLVVVYQTLNIDEAAAQQQGNAGPMEKFAKDQSLLLARFALDGAELFRGPIVAHAPDKTEDNFPDHCLLWLGDRLLVSTGGERQLKIREVDLEANILATHIFATSPTTIPGEIGNSMLYNGQYLLFFSAGNPHDAAQLTVTQLTDRFDIAGTTEFYEESRRQNFPTGGLFYNGFIFIGYISQERSGVADVESNPFAPYLKLLDTNLDIVTDIKIGDEGFAHVHPTLTRLDNRLFVAWSRRTTNSNTPGLYTPQVFVEEFELN